MTEQTKITPDSLSEETKEKMKRVLSQIFILLGKEKLSIAEGMFTMALMIESLKEYAMKEAKSMNDKKEDLH